MSRTCDNCKAEIGPDDLFCENCGYDFITGSLPTVEPTVEPTDSSATAQDDTDADQPGVVADVDAAGDVAAEEDAAKAPSVLDGPDATSRVVLTVAADRAYFDAVVTEGELDFPDPAPVEAELELYGRELHIGRTSQRRGVHPHIDVEALTGDPAVSTRHAVLRVADDGSYTLTDVGSTNGTFVSSFDGDPITQGIPVPVEPGVPVYLGAWTCLTLSQ